MNKLFLHHPSFITGKQSLMPIAKIQQPVPVVCFNCQFVNEADFNYCTTCGYPVVAEQDFLSMYFSRLKQRRKQVTLCRHKVAGARNVLYVGAACCSLAALYYSSDFKPLLIRSLVLLIMASLFFSFGRWSNFKPFTSLLISFVIMITLVAYNTWAELNRPFYGLAGWFILSAQLILLLFLMQGVKAAFKADILKEDC